MEGSSEIQPEDYNKPEYTVLKIPQDETLKQVLIKLINVTTQFSNWFHPVFVLRGAGGVKNGLDFFFF